MSKKKRYFTPTLASLTKRAEALGFTFSTGLGAFWLIPKDRSAALCFQGLGRLNTWLLMCEEDRAKAFAWLEQHGKEI